MPRLRAIAKRADKQSLRLFTDGEHSNRPIETVCGYPYRNALIEIESRSIAPIQFTLRPHPRALADPREDWFDVSGPMPAGTILVAAFFFAALAWLNCAAIQRWESGEANGIAPMGCMLGCAGIAAALALCFVDARVAALLLSGSVSALLLALLDRRRKQLTPLALRACADVVLLTPLVLLLG